MTSANKFNYFGKTDPGKTKESNEDAFNGFVHNDTLFLVVADGMGTSKGADSAAIIAVSEVQRHIETHMTHSDPEALTALVKGSMQMTNRVIMAYRRANDTLYGNIATTLTICAVNQSKDIVIGHAGNSRLYLFRKGNFVQMTKDHTEAQELFKQGKINRDELRLHPERFTLTNALGIAEGFEPETVGGKLAQHDILFLATDGVFNLLNEEEMKAVILESGNSESSANWMIEGANTRGGTDNSTALFSYINF